MMRCDHKGAEVVYKSFLHELKFSEYPSNKADNEVCQSFLPWCDPQAYLFRYFHTRHLSLCVPSRLTCLYNAN
jgi:hypothetical protein